MKSRMRIMWLCRGLVSLLHENFAECKFKTGISLSPVVSVISILQ